MTEPRLIRQSRTVDSGPFRDLYEAHCGYVWNTLRRLGVRERDLEDVAHEVFLAVYKRLADYDPARPLRPWLFGFCFRTASDYRGRAQYQRELVEGDVEVIDETPAADQQIEAHQRRTLVNAALDKIELGRRAVFVMHEIDGCAIPEVAAALGIPLNTAYSRLRLARADFADAVKRLQGARPERRSAEGAS